MSNHETDEDRKVLPKPIVLTREEAQRVVAGAAAALPVGGKPPTLTGYQRS